MKRTAVSLFVWLAISGWAAAGNAKRGGGAAKAVEAAPAAETKAAEEEKPAADPAAAAEKEEAPAPTESLDTDESKTGGDVGEDGAEAKPVKVTTASWQDIVVVPRKAFLKSHRFEFAPFGGTSVNDNLIRHYVLGLDLNFFLTDVFSVGLQGQYFVKSFTEREDLIGLQYNRIPTLNHYLYAAALNFGYVPVYGKFALFNRSIVSWEIYASGGIGVIRTEVIPRNPGSLPWTNDLLAPNVGFGTRFFLFDWLTLNFAVRDQIFADRFEDRNRAADQTLAQAKAQQDSQIVQNILVYAGVGFYLPTKFQYQSPR